ncbi:MAG: excinuclease ABC subunit UvrA, partial [Thermoguttaceae bacterium]
YSYTAEFLGKTITKSQNTNGGKNTVDNDKTGNVDNKTLKHKKAGTSQKTDAGAIPGVNAITVRGAEEHNLKSVSVDIPRGEMTVFCGPSGSGKSSLAMDTIYAEGQRRYVESLSSYARQFVGQMQKPKVEQIDGLSPAIAIEQKAASHSPRSTVGTVTEIHDYLRVLFARLGVPYCPDCNIPIGTQSLDEIVAKIMMLDPNKRLLIAAPLIVDVGQQYQTLWNRLKEAGFVRVRVDGKTYKLDAVPEMDRRRKYAVEVIVDRIVLSEDRSGRGRISESVETALEFGNGVVHVIEVDPKRDEADWKMMKQSRHLSCDRCGRSFEPLTPHHFSFNSPLGWCPHCEGLGVQSGANPLMFIRDPKLTLAKGAVALFPDVNEPLFNVMLAAFSEKTGIPIDVPFDQLDARFRRMIFHGTGDTWFSTDTTSNTLPTQFHFKFQFKGLYPALEEAGRLVPALRGRLEYMVDEVECGVCLGSRLRDDVAAVRFLGETMDQMCRRPLADLIKLFEDWVPNDTERKIAGDLLEEVYNRLRFLIDVGLEYLTLSRPSPTLSGGETQRIRLAAQIGSGLVGVLYVLDEPTIGLHPRDNMKLVSALHKLRDLGNTLLLVEHDKEVIEGADTLVDFGPKAGKFGGEIVAAGSPKVVSKKKTSVTGPYLSSKKSISIPKNRRISISQAATSPVK